MNMCHRRSLKRQAYTVAEFRERNGIRRHKWYQLRKVGLAPKTFRIGGTEYVTAREERAWRKMAEEGVINRALAAKSTVCK